MAAEHVVATVRLSEVEPFAGFLRKVGEADAAFRSMTVTAVAGLPDAVVKGIMLLQEAMQSLPLGQSAPGRAVPPSAAPGPRDFSAEVHSHISGKGPGE